MAELILMPKLGFDMAEGAIARWVKAEGETVERGEVLAEIETDKATVEVEAQVGGVVHKHLVAEGTATPVGTPIAVIGAPGEQIDIEALVGAGAEGEPVSAPEAVEKEAPPEPTRAPAEEKRPSGDGRLPEGVRASPVARRLAAEHGLDLKAIAGSGPGGRIVKKDVEVALATAEPTRAVPAAPIYLPPAAPGETERVPLPKLRQAIGRRMAASKQQAPHFYITADLDAAPVMALREELNGLLPEEHRLSVNDFIVKAAALALRRFPNLNASLDGDEIVRHGEVNVGVAVALDEGLLTVVVRQADLKPLRLISGELRDMITRAREGRVRADDIEGSTFTVSNLGMLNVDHFIAIINPPEAAILAVGSVRDEPVIENGEIVPGQRLKVTLSADHRLTDGAEAARWLKVFRGYVELPLQVLL